MVEVDDAFSDTMVRPLGRVVTEASLADAGVGVVEGRLLDALNESVKIIVR